MSYLTNVKFRVLKMKTLKRLTLGGKNVSHNLLANKGKNLKGEHLQRKAEILGRQKYFQVCRFYFWHKMIFLLGLFWFPDSGWH